MMDAFSVTFLLSQRADSVTFLMRQCRGGGVGGPHHAADYASYQRSS
jgi:hypothetical protein